MTAERNLTTLAPVDSSQFKSTYARLLVSLTKTYFNVPDKTFDSTLASATITYAGLSQLHEKLSTVSDNTSLRTATKEVLDKLKTIPTPAAKTMYDTLIHDAEPLFKSNEELEIKGSAFSKTFDESRDRAFKALENVLVAVVSAKDPEEKAHSQEIVNQLIMSEKTRKSLQAELEQLRKAQLVSNSQLGTIFQRAYDAVPTANREGLPHVPSLPPMERAVPSMSGNQ